MSIIKVAKPRRKAITWDSALDLYETHLRASRKAEGTIRGYGFEFKRFRGYMERAHRAPVLPAEVTLDDLRRYQVGLMDGSASRTGKPQAVETVHRITTTLGGSFKFLVAEGKLDHDPTLRLERPKLPDRLVGDVLDVPEVERLLAAPDTTTPQGLRDKALVEILFASAVRRNEALGLDLGDLNHKERTALVHGKGSKDRLVPVTRSAWLHLTAYLERGRPTLATTHPDSASAVFLSSLGRRMSESSILKTLRALGVKAGINKRLTPHTLRRTCATVLLKAGVNVRVIQELLGHRNLNTTARYLRLDASELRRQLLLDHPRERIES
jgi:integrase/recombinase XerD